MANRDFTKAPLQILLDQINEDNSSAFTTGVLDFGAAAADSSGAKNTKIVATPKVGSGFKDTRDIFYNRVNLATVPGSRGTDFQMGNATHVSDLIPEINAKYGIQLTAADYVDALLPTFTGNVPHDTKTFDLVAAAASVIWTGTLTLTLDANDISLTTAIPNNQLNGLTYVQPT